MGCFLTCPNGSAKCIACSLTRSGTWTGGRTGKDKGRTREEKGGKGKEREGRRVGCEEWGPSIVTNNLLTSIINLVKKEGDASLVSNLI